MSTVFRPYVTHKKLENGKKKPKVDDFNLISDITAAYLRRTVHSHLEKLKQETDSRQTHDSCKSMTDTVSVCPYGAANLTTWKQVSL